MQVRITLSSEIRAAEGNVRCMKTFTHSNTSYLAMGDYNGFLTIIKCNEKDLHRVKSIKAHNLCIASVFYQTPSKEYPDGVFLTAGSDGLIKFWAIKDIACECRDILPLRVLTVHDSTVSCIFNTEFGKVLSSSWDKTLKLTSPDNNTVTLFQEIDQIVCATQCESGYISCSKNCMIRLLDENGKVVFTVENAHKNNIRQIRYLKESKVLYSIGDDGCIVEWIVNNNEITKKRTLKLSNENIYHFNINGNQIVAGGDDHCVFIVDKMHFVIRDVIALPSTIWAMTYLPNKDLAVATEDGFVRTFTNDFKRRASQERQKEYSDEVANTVLWIPSLQSTKINLLPESTSELEAVPGVLCPIRDKDEIRIVIFSKMHKWIYLGKLRQQTHKIMYKDKLYDACKDFDVGNGRIEKIYLNYDDSAYIVAKSFIIQHKLDPSLVSTVENVILQDFGHLMTSKLRADHQEESGMFGMLSYGVATMCGRRDTMEDAHFCVEESPIVACFGLFDGHGGSEAAEYCAQRLPRTIKSNRCAGNFYEQLFSHVQKYMAKEFTRCGTTACIVSFASGVLTVANLGDTRCVLCRQTPLRMSVDHRVSMPEEKKYIEERGGQVVNGRIRNALAVSRALGDGMFSEYLNTEPSYMEEKLIPGDRVVIACDGVWDYLSDEDVSKIVREADSPLKAAKLVRDEAYNANSHDNLTVIVIFTKHE